jgi:hypothetical protein
MTNLKQGDRIKLLAMPDDPAPIPAGATGTVKSVVPQRGIGGVVAYDQVWVQWDQPHERRSLSLCVPPDQFEVIQ